MKKMLSILTFSVFMVSCGSSPARGVSSVDGNCSLQKHPSKNHYRILINDEPHSQYWYSKKDALKFKKNFVKKGLCE